MRVSAAELEGVVLARLQELGSTPDLLNRLIAEANRRLARRLPGLQKRRASLVKTMTATKAEADVA